MRVVVRGEERLDAIGRRLEDAADGGLAEVLVDGLEEAARLLPSRVKENAARALPRAGGLADIGSRAVVEVVVQRSKSAPGLSVTVSSDDLNVELADSGRVVHPVFGNRRVLVGQSIAARSFSRPLEDHEGAFAEGAEDSVRDLARHIEQA